MPPDAARNEMLLQCYIRVTFGNSLNAVFNPQCYIATENGQKRPNFGGDFCAYTFFGMAVLCNYRPDFSPIALIIVNPIEICIFNHSKIVQSVFLGLRSRLETVLFNSLFVKNA